MKARLPWWREWRASDGRLRRLPSVVWVAVFPATVMTSLTRLKYPLRDVTLASSQHDATYQKLCD